MIKKCTDINILKDHSLEEVRDWLGFDCYLQDIKRGLQQLEEQGYTQISKEELSNYIPISQPKINLTCSSNYFVDESHPHANKNFSFDVPFEWLETWLLEQTDWMNVDEFLDEYTWDNSYLVYLDARNEKILTNIKE